MDIVDRDMEEAEREASRNYTSPRLRPIRAAHTTSQLSPPRDSLGQNASHTSSLSTSTSSTTAHEGDMGRIATASGADISRTRTHPTANARIETHRLQHSGTVGASVHSKSRKEKELPAFGGGKPYPPPLPPYEDYVVEYDGPDDPLHPQNWPMKKKVFIAIISAYTSFCSTFTSSLFSASTHKISEIYHVQITVATLGTSLYVLGYCFGPLVWAPFSELKGRKPPILVAMFGFMCFNFACATSKDIQTLMICRFWAGFFGSSPLVVVSAIFADMFDNTQRGAAIVVFASTVFLGPFMGPSVGGFVEASYLGWRWTLYLPGIMGALAVTLNAFILRESYAPVVLVGKAKELRRLTKNWGIHAKQEEVEVDLKELLVKNFTRPIRLLVTEPVVLAVSLYMSFIYGLIYCFLTAYPLVFSGVHGWNEGEAGLPFFAMIIGLFIVAIYIVAESGNYNKKLAANNGIPIPEWRLPPAMIGGVCFTLGLFWFGWTGWKKEVHWIVPTLSGLFTGFGLLAIFIQLFNYIIDSYLMFAASAIAANTFLRSLFATAFPLFSRQMFNNMGIEWAATLLGCVSAILIPIPVLFYFYGKNLRAKSKFAPTMKSKPTDDIDSGEDEQHHMVALHASRSRATAASSRTQTRSRSTGTIRNETNGVMDNNDTNHLNGVDLEKADPALDSRA